MIGSASKSLKKNLTHLDSVAVGNVPVPGMDIIYHSLRGLFLNMGEPRWAAYTNEIERKLLVGEPVDHTKSAGILRRGVAEILAYCGTSKGALFRRGGS